MGNIIWVPEKNCYCYKSRVLIPMRFNDPSIYGIAVEGVLKRKAPDFSDAYYIAFYGFFQVFVWFLVPKRCI
jgi:hypothetical protein